MAAEDMNPTIAQLISTHDFATSQSSFHRTDLLQGLQAFKSRSYLLIQETQDRQTLAPLSEKSGPSYHIKRNYQNPFHKLHMVITKEQEGRSNSVISTKSPNSRRRSSLFSNEKEHGKLELAIIELDTFGPMMEIVYKGKSHAQTVSLSDPSTQTYICSIDGQEHQWRPLGPSRTVLELVGSREQRLALFLYTRDNSSASDVGVQRRVSLGVRHDVGELHTLVDVDENTRVYEEVLFSVLAVVDSRRIK